MSGARLWVDEAGSGPAVLLLHGGLGDSGLWEPVVPFLAERFRTIRTDLRFFGRSTGPAAPWSWEADVIGILDELEVERVALVGLSLGGSSRSTSPSHIQSGCGRSSMSPAASAVTTTPPTRRSRSALRRRRGGA